MFIKKINGLIRYHSKHRKFIRSLRPFEGSKWDSQTNDMKALKSSIKDQLLKIQGRECAFCGLPFDETSGSEIEHFAPKGKLRDGRVLYPQFMFTRKNLSLACSLCNGFEKKGVYNTISVLNKNYNLCQFSIVHPYLDNPDDHYQFSNTFVKVLIQHKSQKGEESIRLFQLDSQVHTEARAKKYLLSRTKALPQNKLQELKDILSYRP